MRDNGTYVQPHYQTNPNSTQLDKAAQEACDARNVRDKLELHRTITCSCTTAKSAEARGHQCGVCVP